MTAFDRTTTELLGVLFISLTQTMGKKWEITHMMGISAGYLEVPTWEMVVSGGKFQNLVRNCAFLLKKFVTSFMLLHNLYFCKIY